MDAFYAAVEVLDNPELFMKPVIVGGGRERGVVSAASYEARRFGIHSAMPIAEAIRRCPDGVFIPPRIQRYREVSAQIFSIFQRYTPLVEPLSLDEAFLDVSGSTMLFGTAEEIAVRIKKEVSREIGLTASAGVASSKLVAKIASDLEKPDGLTIVAPGGEEDFLGPLPVSKLWGVGPAARHRLNLMGITTIGGLRALSRDFLESTFGKQGTYYYSACRGRDFRPVEPERETQSMGHEETFSRDLTDPTQLHRELLSLAVRVAERLRRDRVCGKVLTLKVKYGDFKQITRSTTLSQATDDSAEILRQALILLRKTEAGKKPVRLLGISCAGFEAENSAQLHLFAVDQGVGKRKKINQAMDLIKERHGATSILPATLLGG